MVVSLCQSAKCLLEVVVCLFFGTYEKEEYATKIKVVKQFLQISRLKSVILEIGCFPNRRCQSMSTIVYS